jgi:DNA primase
MSPHQDGAPRKLEGKGRKTRVFLLGWAAAETVSRKIHSGSGPACVTITASNLAKEEFPVPLFDDDAKDRIRAAVNLVDLVGSYLELRRQGRHYVALCPWHDDSRPSLQINPDRQTWKCWVCNLGGDIFSFVQQREGVGFREALEMLADRAGIELRPTAPQARPTAGGASDKHTLYKALEWAAQQFHDCLLTSDEGSAARAYLQERGISPESVKKWRLGYAPDQWQWLLDRAAQTPFSPEVLETVGLTGKSEQTGKPYDRFKGRIIFPIRDVALHTIAVGGRILPEVAARDEQRTGRKPAKYVNSPETRLFSKSEHLYGLDIARDAIAKNRNQRELIITEGYTDVIVARQEGVENVAAVLGTALTERHIPLIRRFADVLYLVLDGDEAGQRRTSEIIQLFVFAPLDLRILTLPHELDPCDYVLQYGGEALAAILPTAVDAIEHKIRLETMGIDLVRDTLRSGKALENLLQTVARAPYLPATTLEFCRLREQAILTRLARLFQLPEAQLRGRLRELRNHSQTKPAATPAAQPARPGYRAAELEPCEAELLEVLTQHPTLVERAQHEVTPEMIRSLPAREIFGTFCRLAREGRVMDFSEVLSALEDAALKSLLVELDERAAAKAAHALEDGFSQLAAVCRVFRDRQMELERRAERAVLVDGQSDEARRLSAFQRLLATQREKLGISESMEG